MARQAEGMKLTGSIGDTTYYKTANGYFARKRGGVSKTKIQTAPSFVRVRENNQEFKAAAQDAGLVRRALKPAIDRIKDKKISSRFFTLFLKMAKTDPVSPRGERVGANGEWKLLDGFEINAFREFPIATELAKHLAIESNSVTLTLADFHLNHYVKHPSATHYKLVVAGASISFKENSFKSITEYSDLLSVNSPSDSTIVLDRSKLQGRHCLYVIGIEFYIQEGTSKFPLAPGKFNCGNILVL
ncbi:hypothetical protein [Litoribacter populi]|uniref:hypothetical protein n=1 Tax=Litoribacter populi TaxID=2598460 RepID=UPI00117E2991|nr:hypothetical protein [Litoribacter populi]